MLQVCGRNEYKQLGENSNNKDFDGEPIISPACNSHLNISSLLAYSVYSSYLVWITKDKKAYAIGFNSVNKICASIPTGKIDKDTEIIFLDDNGQRCNFLSVVCGTYYTLYLISSQNYNKNNRLAFVFQGENNGNPLFLNTGDSCPISLFGGRLNAAAIDSKGSILLLTDIVFKSPLSRIKPSILPNNERAICVGCSDTIIIALSSTGRVYEYILNDKTQDPTFSEVNELRGIKCIDVSGAYNHCLVVTDEGKVYCRGSNASGQLGIGNHIKNAEKFVQITQLNDEKIVHASAGRFHSLFLTDDGKIFACGLNNAGSLLLKSGNSKGATFLPVETSITSGASYCFAGNSLSTVIIGPDIPPNMPNRPTEVVINVDQMKKSIQQKDQIIEQLRKQNEIQKKKIEELQSKLKEKEIKTTKSSSSKSKKLDIIDINDIDKIKKITKIGRGSMAKVFKVSMEQMYAMKVINIDQNDDDKSDSRLNFDKMRRFLQEYELLMQLNHPNIINAYGFCFGDENNKPFILLEYCPFNLHKCVKTLNKEEQISIIIEISDAMKHVHEAGIIHRDLKLENILLDQEMHVKLSDFGVSTFIKLDSETMSRTQMIGTLRFMAPELILEKTDYDEKVDVYAFGIVFYLILSKGEYPKISIGDIAKGKTPPIPSTFSKFSKELIIKCLSFEPSNRPTFNEIYQSIKSNKSKIF